VFAGFGESGPALVHYVVIGEGDNLDSAGLQAFEQGNGRVEQEWLGPVRACE
jgi:hypothetical protein